MMNWFKKITQWLNEKGDIVEPKNEETKPPELEEARVSVSAAREKTHTMYWPKDEPTEYEVSYGKTVPLSTLNRYECTGCGRKAYSESGTFGGIPCPSCMEGVMEVVHESPRLAAEREQRIQHNSKRRRSY